PASAQGLPDTGPCQGTDSASQPPSRIGTWRWHRTNLRRREPEAIRLPCRSLPPTITIAGPTPHGIPSPLSPHRTRLQEDPLVTPPPLPARSLALLVALLLCITGPLIAGDWPCWRGPTGQGHSDEKDLPLTWDAKKGENVLWKAELHGGRKLN